MKDSILKSMTKQEYDRFKDQAFKSKMKQLQSNGKDQEFELLIAQTARDIQPKLIDQQIQQTKRKLESYRMSKEQKDVLQMTLRELMTAKEELLDQKKKQKDDMQIQQKVF